MTKSILNRIRWNNVGIALTAAMLAGGVGYSYWDDVMHPTQIVEYRKEVDAGDTLWSICGKVATNKEDMGRLVWQTMQDNQIDKPGELQPGRVIIIRVKEARKL